MTGSAFRAWRKGHGWTQPQAAMHLRVFQGVISEWERCYRGRKIPPYIARMAELIDEVDHLREELTLTRGTALDLVQVGIALPPGPRRSRSRTSQF